MRMQRDAAVEENEVKYNSRHGWLAYPATERPWRENSKHDQET